MVVIEFDLIQIEGGCMREAIACAMLCARGVAASRRRRGFTSQKMHSFGRGGWVVDVAARRALRRASRRA
eukprot:8490250-Lingulodinium_polyedra.AAC.1